MLKRIKSTAIERKDIEGHEGRSVFEIRAFINPRDYMVNFILAESQKIARKASKDMARDPDARRELSRSF